MLDVAVIGSGYGGAVVAARLAAHARVLLVERGGWWRPGDFPLSIGGLARSYMTTRNPGGLWATRLGVGTGLAFASAFGGSSAINYGITAQPDDHAFDDWPLSPHDLAPWFERARRELGASADPRADELADKRVLDELEPGCRVDLENTIDWSRCDRCGRCVPGCNHGAKRSLDRTYLERAMREGVELRLRTELIDLVAVDGGYRLHLRTAGASEWVSARRVVLAAGTLGTLDLLHRSRLPLGPWFGRGLSMNGDGLAFLYDTRRQISGHSGAPISTSARLRFTDDDGRRRSLMVMSGRVPMAAMRFAAAGLAALAGVLVDRRARRDHAAGRWLRRLRDLVAVTERGALAHSFMYKLDGQDSSLGNARFTSDGAVVDWPGYTEDPIMRFARTRLHGWAERIGGLVIPDVATLPGMRSFSVHPLGGCRMGLDLADGVVDPLGRVLDPRGGVYPGLRIADGSIVRGSLGVPPSLTIAALAERIAADLQRELGQAARQTLRRAPPAPSPSR